MKFRALLPAALVGLLLTAFNNCGSADHELSLNSQGSIQKNSLAVGTANAQAALNILSTNCASCHNAPPGNGGVSQILDPNILVSSGLVVPGHPESSPLVQCLAANRMPPSGPLSDTDKATISAWISASVVTTPSGSTALPVTPVVVSPGSSPAAPATPVTGTLEQRAITILNTNCYTCHGNNGAGGVSQINNPSLLISAGTLVPGNAAGSILFQDVNSGKMPPTGKLAAADISTLSDWINAGANSPTAGTVAPPPAIPALGPTYASLSANIFIPKCSSCHGATVTSDGIRLDSYSSTFRLVRPGSPTSSRLYTACANGDMPPGRNSLSAAELQALSTWISNQAPNN